METLSRVTKSHNSWTSTRIIAAALVLVPCVDVPSEVADVDGASEVTGVDVVREVAGMDVASEIASAQSLFNESWLP
jgi:hypothetical protein